MFHLQQATGILIFLRIAAHQSTVDLAGAGHFLAWFNKTTLEILRPQVDHFFQ
jgi:ABC-type tungstate transport system permease subunit